MSTRFSFFTPPSLFIFLLAHAAVAATELRQNPSAAAIFPSTLRPWSYPASIGLAASTSARALKPPYRCPHCQVGLPPQKPPSKLVRVVEEEGERPDWVIRGIKQGTTQRRRVRRQPPWQRWCASCRWRMAASDSGHLTQGNDGRNDGDRAVSFLIPTDVRDLKFRENLNLRLNTPLRWP